MDENELLEVDRVLCRTATAWRTWRRALRSGEALAQDPFEATRWVSGRSLFVQLSELPDSAPLKDALRRWVYRLAEQRINRDCLVELTRQRRLVLHHLDAPEHGQFSLADMLGRALREAGQRPLWLRAFVDYAPAAGRTAALLWQRRQEVARRMGLDGPEVMETVNPDLLDVTWQWLASSAELAAEVRPRDLADLITTALGRGGNEGWPSRLVPRTLLELLHNADLFRGLSVDAGALPQALAPASFYRALARVGAAWADAAAPRTQPFCVAHDPYGLRRRSHGALFGLLPLNPEFGKRRLKLTAAGLSEQLRAASSIVALESRAAALRVLLRRPAHDGHRSFTEAFEAHTAQVHGVVVPGHCAGVLWQLHVDDAQRFAGLLLGAAQAERLRAEHDADWFRNPRAAQQLRAEAALSPEPRMTSEALRTGADALRRMLTEALD